MIYCFLYSKAQKCFIFLSQQLKSPTNKIFQTQLFYLKIICTKCDKLLNVHSNTELQPHKVPIFMKAQQQNSNKFK